MTGTQTVDQILSASEENSPSRWNSIKSALGKSDKVQKTGMSLGGYWLGVKAGLAPSGEEIVEAAPEDLSIGGAEINLEALAEEGENFFDEKIWARERNAETMLEEATMRADKLGHYSLSYLAASVATRAVDKVTNDYDPKKVALGGMAVVPLYVVAKEGFIEGGEGFQIDPESADQRADAIADFLGASHSVYNFHRKKTAESEEEATGVLGTAARTAGRAYEKARNKVGDTDYQKMRQEPDDVVEIQDETEEGYSLIEENVIDSAEVSDRGELQNLIGEVADIYDEGVKTKIDLEFAAEKLIQDYGHTVRNEAIDGGYDVGADKIVEKKLEGRDLNSETAEEALTAAVNRYNLEYDSEQSPLTVENNQKKRAAV